MTPLSVHGVAKLFAKRKLSYRS